MIVQSVASAVPARSRRFRTATVAALVLALGPALAGCATDPSPTAPPPAGAPDQAGPTTGGPAAGGEEVDDCSLLTEAEITDVIGRAGTGVAGADGCVWENRETGHSVTLFVGRPGTAPQGVLPPPDPVLGEPEPGPDGIRFVIDEAEFADGDRICRLRVVTSVVDDRDRDTMVRLAGLVRDRL
ncbi:DUF3558 family protein [Micromonospora sp. WMMD558]|uniref:DUF3558 family protein n=1 Tax=unclassified Micromonospora TaxID=2617518 RepID=UPI0012B4D0CF|nr:DUF3558 family protein [Micromonospora sp. WMMC415]QGN47585.1 DUF3558 domain-containing protein [Micromonospora sp. WMMC415]